MTIQEYYGLPYLQRASLAEVYHRKEFPITWKEFIESAHHNKLLGCITVPWAGMLLGIEEDGHTHS